MKKTVARNFLFLTFGELVARFFSLFLTLFIANVFGKEGLGEFSLAMSVIAYFTFFTDFGLTLLGTREIAANKEEASAIGTNVLFIQTALAVVLMLVLFILVNIFPVGHMTKLLIVILGMGLIPFALNLNYIFQAFQRMEFVAYVKILTQFTYVGLGLLTLFFFRDITYAAVSNVIGNLLGAALSIFLVIRWFNYKFTGFSWEFAKKLFVQSIPMGISAFLVQVFFNFDTTALGFMKGEAVVGIYNAAYKIMLVISSFGYSYFGALFPVFAEKFKENDIAKIKDMAETSLRILFFASLPIIAGVVATSPLIFKLLFKHDFSDSTIILQILIFDVLFVWLTNFFGSMLIAAGHTRQELFAVACGTLLNVFLNILLIPHFGAVASAYISVLSQGVNFFAAYLLIGRHVKVDIFRTSYKALINAVVMLIVLLLIFSHAALTYKTLVLEVSLGLLVYGVLSLITKSIPKQEVFFKYGQKVLSERLGIKVGTE